MWWRRVPDVESRWRRRLHTVTTLTAPRPRAGPVCWRDGGNVTADDLIVAAPWLAFAAGLAVIAWRLALGRRRRRRRRSVARNAWPRDR
jgi:hypothetical protein